MAIPGRATREGTRRSAKKNFRDAFGLAASSIGIGTYLGSDDARTDRLVTDAVAACARGGVNVIDTAINYRLERGERSVGEALKGLAREELIVCTKGGFVPAKDPAAYFAREYPKLKPEALVAGCHCMHPEYLLDQLDRSRANLGIETIDVYYVHNPETQLSEIDPDGFYRRLGEAFCALEGAVRAGKIAAYGLATWSAFRVPPGSEEHVELERAKAVAGPHFRFVQLPVNLAMPEAIFQPTQTVGGRAVPALEAARRLSLAVVSSASICQARAVGHVPEWMSRMMPELRTDAQRALQFTRSAPGLLTALVGMKSPAHVEENLAVAAVPPADNWSALMEAAE